MAEGGGTEGGGTEESGTQEIRNSGRRAEDGGRRAVDERRSTDDRWQKAEGRRMVDDVAKLVRALADRGDMWKSGNQERSPTYHHPSPIPHHQFSIVHSPSPIVHKSSFAPSLPGEVTLLALLVARIVVNYVRVKGCAPRDLAAP